jgi:hypothetical protein
MVHASISPNDSQVRLMVHYLVERRGDQWQAFSLEFGLAAQADSENDARRKLESMVNSYVYDALVGEDHEHAGLLLSRRATAAIYLRYYLARAKSRMGGLGGGRGNNDHHLAYEKPIPLQPPERAA